MIEKVINLKDALKEKFLKCASNMVQIWKKKEWENRVGRKENVYLLRRKVAGSATSLKIFLNCSENNNR